MRLPKRRRSLLVALVVAVLVGVGAAAYFALVPGKLAGDYRDRAMLPHDRLDDAMERVFDTRE